jgi:hypothetical protein
MRRCGSIAVLILLAAAVVADAGCGAADGELDPEDLSVRDLLGVDPQVALRWTPAQRASARRVLDAALAAPVDGSAFAIASGGEATLGALVHGALVRVDVERERRGAAPVVVARIEQESPDVWVQPVRTNAVLVTRGAEVTFVASGWDDALAPLPARGAALIEQLASAAGRTPGAPDDADDAPVLLVQPAPRAPFAVAYVPSAELLLVNPVLLAALEPGDREHAASAPGATNGTSATSATSAPGATLATSAAAATSGGAAAKTGSLGNPYSFFGSLGECSAAQQQRCEACLPTTTCTPVTRDASDGNAECTALAADGGRGYYLLCLNVALAIRTVSSCVDGRAPAATCPQVFVGNQLASLEVNATFLDTPTCVAALDACLAEIYGAPASPFPTGPDGGVGTPPPPPRDVNVSCGDCSSDSSCDFSPQCDPQCDSSCQGGSCGDCSRGDGTASSSGGCGSCDSGGSSSGSGGDCSSCDSSSGSSCDSGGSSSSSGGSSCGSCDSGGSSSGGSSCGSSCDKSGSSGGGSGCSTAGRVPVVRAAVNLVSVGWACLPLIVLLAWRRRELRRLSHARARAAAAGGDA